MRIRGPSATRIRHDIDAAVEHWIGWSLPPPRRAIEASGWCVDGTVDYCGRCGGSVGPGEATAAGCASCRATRAPAQRTVRLGSYDAHLREWILAVKYRAWWEMGMELGRLLGQTCRHAGIGGASLIVVPMPMPWPRRMYRGIDHAAAIARGAADELGAPMLHLLRRHHHPPQTSRALTQRRRGGRLGMFVRSGHRRRRLAGADLLVVDDVRTTGTTLRGAVDLLRTTSASRVFAGIVAAADEPSRRSESRL